MSDEPLTFSELRKIQKKEQRQDDLSELGDRFILKVSNYLDMKKETSGESREYRNARRVFDKIISLREEKIVRNARIAVKSGLNPTELNLLPSEQEFYRELEEVMKDHRERTGRMAEDDPDETAEEIEDAGDPDLKSTDPVNHNSVDEDSGNQEEDTEDQKKTEDDEQESEDQGKDIEEPEEGYIKVEITSDVPEFMGTDLETYGPFDEGEKAKIPEDNAEILTNRGNAEEI